MAEPTEAPAVFTTDNEPYLGLPSVLWFDRVIVWALDCSGRVAAYKHASSRELVPLQHAACQIIPQGINIALAIRELIRQAYLFPALVLMRPLIERAAVMSWLCLHPDEVPLWHAGWPHRKRPALQTMLEAMGGTAVGEDQAKQVKDAHNHIVHGDPIGSYHSLVPLGDGRVGYAPGKMLDSPDVADAVAMEAQCYLLVLTERMRQVFAQLEFPAGPGSQGIAARGVAFGQPFSSSGL
jgi:hypothetical protein